MLAEAVVPGLSAGSPLLTVVSIGLVLSAIGSQLYRYAAAVYATRTPAD